MDELVKLMPLKTLAYLPAHGVSLILISNRFSTRTAY